jgi:hypothetical protein
VLDPSINTQQMEMYADVDARAGVLGLCRMVIFCVHYLNVHSNRT